MFWVIIFVVFLLLLFLIIKKVKTSTYKLKRKSILKYKNIILKNKTLKDIVKEYGYSIFVKEKYNKEFRSEIIKNVLKEYDSSLIYTSDKGIAESDYKQANFDSFDYFLSEDLIEGYIGDIPYLISEVKTDTNLICAGKSETVSLFHGLVAKMELPKNLDSYISILYSGLKTYTNDFYCLVDNPNFQKRHDVYSNNEGQAMQILSLNVTNIILDLEEKMRVCFEIKIINNLVYIRFQTADIFKTDIYNLETEAHNIAEYLLMLEGTKKVLKVILDTVNKVL